jgi:hypothetical protein
MAARLVLATLPPHRLPATARAARAAAFRVWLGSLALPSGVRVPLARVADATARDPLRDPGPALRALADVVEQYLDAASHAELAQLAERASAAATGES